MNRPNIFDYEDYRKFLKDWYLWMKETNSAFSYRAFSNWAGFHSPNHLQLIIQGKRNITSSTLNTFLKILKLKRREQKFFEMLVNFNQAPNPEAKARYLLEIADCQKKYGEHLKHEQYEYLTKWYFPVIRELIATKDFRENHKWIADKIGHGVKPKQVEDAIEKLLSLGLITRDKKGKLKQAFSVVTTGPESFESAVYHYHEQMLKMAIVALSKQPPKERNYAGITLACSKDDIPEIAQIIYDFRKRVLDYLESRPNKDDDDDVYQLGVQLFRLTKPGK